MPDTFLGKVENTIANTNTGMNVGIDNAVNVVINKYEEALMKRRDSISVRRDEVVNKLKAHDKEISERVDTSPYEVGMKSIGVSVKITDITPVWVADSEDDSYLRLTVMLTDEDETNPHTATFGKYIKEEIIESDRDLHKANVEILTAIRNELNEVDGLFDNVDRKERQVRARINEICLKDAGYSNLIEDEQITALTALD